MNSSHICSTVSALVIRIKQHRKVLPRLHIWIAVVVGFLTIQIRLEASKILTTQSTLPWASNSTNFLVILNIVSVAGKPLVRLHKLTCFATKRKGVLWAFNTPEQEVEHNSLPDQAAVLCHCSWNSNWATQKAFPFWGTRGGHCSLPKAANWELGLGLQIKFYYFYKLSGKQAACKMTKNHGK